MSRNLCILLAFALSGCATSNFSYGRGFPIENAHELKKGVSTKQDVLRLFGEPFSRTMSDSLESWQYIHSTSTATAQSFLVATSVQSTGSHKNMMVQFKSDTVQKFTYTEGKNPGSGNTTVYP